MTPTEPVAAAQRTFRVLLTAMANPGTVQMLDLRPGETPEEAIAFALCDHEVSFAVVGQPDAAGAVPVSRRITLRTGSVEADIADAAFVFAYGPLGDERWGRVRQGSLAYPDGGATVVYALPAIGVRAALSQPLRSRLTGPGIETETWLSLVGLPGGELAARNRACAEYPMGVDCIFVDAHGQVACLPRSTTVEIEQIEEA